MSVPWSDPQFWVVTLLVVAAVVGMVRSLRRASGGGADGEKQEPACSHCALAPGSRGQGSEAEEREAAPTARAS
ncbi:MAG: hypothetical protein SX243_10535 [Acidobacteriota bacterium]|nr:hypothetical protein [Acidobacteriota bacterium]